jgi:hypothetical protein
MHARVATFEHSGDVDQMIDDVRKDVEGGTPPPGLESAKGMMMLVDRAGGKSMGIVLFDTEEEMRRGDAALNEMSPSGGGDTRRTGVDFYEVPVSRMA